jgi:hypothetical protein
MNKAQRVLDSSGRREDNENNMESYSKRRKKMMVAITMILAEGMLSQFSLIRDIDVSFDQGHDYSCYKYLCI